MDSGQGASGWARISFHEATPLPFDLWDRAFLQEYNREGLSLQEGESCGLRLLSGQGAAPLWVPVFMAGKPALHTGAPQFRPPHCLLHDHLPFFRHHVRCSSYSDGRNNPVYPRVLSLMRIKSKKDFCKLLHFIFIPKVTNSNYVFKYIFNILNKIRRLHTQFLKLFCENQF